MPYVDADDGAKLYYNEYGPRLERDPLILIHGSLGDYRDWANQAPLFSESKFRVVAYSRRNHYPNTWKDYPSNYSLLTERDDLITLIRDLSDGPASLIGHSYGGFVAALVARDYPSFVSKLVLAEPPIFTMLNSKGDLNLAEEFVKETVEPAKRYLMINEFESAVKVFLDGIAGRHSYDRLKPQVREVMKDNAKTARHEIEITLERDPFDCKDARRITSPTLLVKGERSPKILKSITNELSKCIPNNKVVTMSRSSHGVIWEDWKLFNKTVVQFLKES
jgi:pimeloyl-ACP methyl ester carboxylesterase